MPPPPPFDYGDLEFTQPAKQIKAFNMEPVPQRILDKLQKYEESQRGFSVVRFEKGNESHVIITHRPADSQVTEYYRMPADPKVRDLQRLTYFDLGSGRVVSTFRSIEGEDWRGIWRGGGAILAMDLDGSENFQLWRYWEDSQCAEVVPPIEGELQNAPGGRIERLTHDNFRYASVVISESNRIMAYTSNKENGTDMLAYVADLKDSNTGAGLDSKPFTLPSRLVTPAAKSHSRWVASDISLDDQYLLLAQDFTSAYRPCFVLRISGGEPEQIRLPNATEKEEEISFHVATFSRDPAKPHLVYVLTNAYGDFRSLLAYDIQSKQVLHITTPEPSLRSLRPINWDCSETEVTSEYVYFTANVDGYTNLFVLPLSGPLQDTVVEIKLDQWEGGEYSIDANAVKPNQLVLRLLSYRTQGCVAYLDITSRLESVQTDENGAKFISVPLERYEQAAPVPTAFRTIPAKPLKFKSFDGLEIPCMYYHPTDGKSVVPLVISIHGGPAAQSKSNSRIPTHWYILNELGYAVIYPNVRGSRGYGKRFMAADDVEKREDSVKDIGSLLDHVEQNMKTELDSSRIAVMGGSYGGYMLLACLIHFPTKFACALANYPIAHWPSFLERTAPVRQAHRRGEYGDERDPAIREFLERISPMNHVSKIRAPLQIAHGETDSRVTVDQAVRMWKTVKESGIHAELMVCGKEGHGFKQKSVIEFTNAAKLHFLERFLPPQ
ncbi:Alpha/Beta hydrolase protein [Roridomyces roridus]|uniref:Dipeptidyl-peptidase V n=1 Tax=Roridomyces roridus TaxID=1738132 RepID=A0AAD7FV10_9AGAR|nr:Alpha/Beta hydrolase protein [Roridomyces roridus]